jgi:DNA repair exonuclease SbcCD nuclease subunit
MGPIHMPPRPDDPTEIYLYGCGWNEKIPEIKHRDDNIRNILLIHRLFSTVKLFPSDDISVHGGDFLKNTGWDLVVAGDNHIHFTFEHKGRYLVNCGSMMRSKIDQMSHKPVVYEYLARDRKLTCTEIPCNEIELVMDVDRIEEFKERDEELEVFVQKIKDKTEIEGLDFELNMDERMQAPDITPEMKELWKEVVHDASARLK